MKGHITGMKNIDYEGYRGPHLPKHIQRERVRAVIEQELTPRQRRAVTGYYLESKTITQMAQEDGVHKSTISRTLHRAERRMRQYLRY